jgi:hypothetical protein
VVAINSVLPIVQKSRLGVQMASQTGKRWRSAEFSSDVSTM